MTLLFDTDILIAYSKGKLYDFIHDLVKPENQFFSSVITIAEFRVGLNKDIQFTMEKIKQMFSPLSLDEEVAEMAGAFRQYFLKRGKTIPLDDHFVAATAIKYNLILVTNNKKDFPHKGLRLYSD